jgi:hypothetical protein
MLQTDTQGHTSNMAMVKSTLFMLSFPESQSLRCLFYRTVCVCPPAARLSQYMTSYVWRPPKHRTFQFPTISNNNMAGTRICEAVTQAKQILTACGHLLLLSVYFKRYLTDAWNRQLIHECWICYLAIRDIAAATYIYQCLCQLTHMNISIHFVWQLQQVRQPHCRNWLNATKTTNFMRTVSSVRTWNFKKSLQWKPK